MRGTLTILFLAVMIAAGLWYWLAPAVTQPEIPEPADATDATTPATGHSQTADSGTTAPADVARATPATGRSQTADSGTTAPADVAQATESGASESARQSAAVEPANDAAAGEIVLSPVPESTIEQVPIATPATDEPRQTDLLASVERVVEQVETAIRERLGPESGEDTDTKPRARMEHDVAAQVDGEGNEAVRTAEAGAAPPTHVAHAAVAGTPTSNVPAQAADSASAPDVARAATDEAIEAEAKQYVETLTAATPQTIPVDEAEAKQYVETLTAATPQTIPVDEAEAKQYVETLTAATPQTIPVDEAEAKQYVETLTAAAPQTIPVDEAEAKQYVETLTAAAPQTIPVDEAEAKQYVETLTAAAPASTRPRRSSTRDHSPSTRRPISPPRNRCSC